MNAEQTMSLHDEAMEKLQQAAPRATPPPAAYRVVTNNTAMSFYLTLDDAKNGAHNRLTYVRGCTSAVVEPLYAAPKTLPSVKTLVWQSKPYGFCATGLGSKYFIYAPKSLGDGNDKYRVNRIDGPYQDVDTLNEAQEAAQADFETRIQSCLMVERKP